MVKRVLWALCAMRSNSGFIMGFLSASLGGLLTRILDKDVIIRFVSVVSMKKK